MGPVKHKGIQNIEAAINFFAQNLCQNQNKETLETSLSRSGSRSGLEALSNDTVDHQGEITRLKGELEGAEEPLEKATLHTELAEQFQSAKNHKEAEKHYIKAVELSKSSLKYLMESNTTLIDFYLETKDTQNVNKLLKEWLQEVNRKVCTNIRPLTQTLLHLISSNSIKEADKLTPTIIDLLNERIAYYTDDKLEQVQTQRELAAFYRHLGRVDDAYKVTKEIEKYVNGSYDVAEHFRLMGEVTRLKQYIQYLKRNAKGAQYDEFRVRELYAHLGAQDEEATLQFFKDLKGRRREAFDFGEREDVFGQLLEYLDYAEINRGAFLKKLYDEDLAKGLNFYQYLFVYFAEELEDGEEEALKLADKFLGLEVTEKEKNTMRMNQANLLAHLGREGRAYWVIGELDPGCIEAEWVALIDPESGEPYDHLVNGEENKRRQIIDFCLDFELYDQAQQLIGEQLSEVPNDQEMLAVLDGVQEQLEHG